MYKQQPCSCAFFSLHIQSVLFSQFDVQPAAKQTSPPNMQCLSGRRPISHTVLWGRPQRQLRGPCRAHAVAAEHTTGGFSQAEESARPCRPCFLVPRPATEKGLDPRNAALLAAPAASAARPIQLPQRLEQAHAGRNAQVERAHVPLVDGDAQQAAA